jgi:hypothetical protein
LDIICFLGSLTTVWGRLGIWSIHQQNGENALISDWAFGRSINKMGKTLSSQIAVQNVGVCKERLFLKRLFLNTFSSSCEFSDASFIHLCQQDLDLILILIFLICKFEDFFLFLKRRIKNLLPKFVIFYNENLSGMTELHTTELTEFVLLFYIESVVCNTHVRTVERAARRYMVRL